jgi:hypothetical protein
MNLSRILCTFSGDDYSIISQCNDKKIQNRFMAIGGLLQRFSHYALLVVISHLQT